MIPLQKLKENLLPPPPRCQDENSGHRLVYLVGGNLILARMLLQWLICAEDGDVPMAAYVFKEENIVLQNQGSDTETVSVNTRKCMIYLTQLADPKEILKDDLIVDQKDLWWEMGFSDSVVDLFDVSTWNDVDYV